MNFEILFILKGVTISKGGSDSGVTRMLLTMVLT